MILSPIYQQTGEKPEFLEQMRIPKQILHYVLYKVWERAVYRLR
ncbi:hypothetical protein KsCSTR_04520 [Candidatus Kuenenia stuttgartiensis]|uniref:Uncharacterized protein n=1 Tax=Kuenenia stuttgartiensis TaxID=174633 RepID=A0A6G7GK80_KUEST|nr:hypothetical protein KsCSTR_04520 [Candidatus Kuenenia stuttgartiensis]